MYLLRRQSNKRRRFVVVLAKKKNNTRHKESETRILFPHRETWKVVYPSTCRGRKN